MTGREFILVDEYERRKAALAEIEAPKRSLVAVDIGEFLGMEIPPREMVMGPIIPSQGLAMIYSKRGVGKTYVALSIAYAVASGAPFLRWEAPKPRRVLFLDGEMPGAVMQERLAQIVKSANTEPPSPEFLRIITPDLQPEGFPDLAGLEGQEAVESHLKGVELVVIDNLSTLCRLGRENESESWGPVQEWILGLRRRGISVLLIHHAGKAGAQRGTSRREDVLDTVLVLRHPADYGPDEGARFEVHVEKGRSIIGEDAKPFEARLEVRDGAAIWTTRDLEDAAFDRVIELAGDGLTVRDIADELGLSKSKVQRLKTRAKAEGRLNG